VDNDSENATDLLGLCKTCKCLNVTVNPNGPKLPMGFYYRPADIISPGGERFGAWIHIHWNLEEKSDPALCRYFINEPPGGVTGRGPDGKTPPSTGVNGEVGQDSDDPLGIPVKRAGKYRIKVNIIQTYTCVSSDGSRTTESRHFKDKAKGTYPQLVGH
jgi:hypothetical protein